MENFPDETLSCPFVDHCEKIFKTFCKVCKVNGNESQGSINFKVVGKQFTNIMQSHIRTHTQFATLVTYTIKRNCPSRLSCGNSLLTV